MKEIYVPTKRGTVLNGVLFEAENADTVVIGLGVVRCRHSISVAFYRYAQ